MQTSRITRVKHGTRETATHVLDSDEFAAYQGADARLVVELFRKGANGRIVESYRFEFSPEDAEHVHRETSDFVRRHRRAAT
jgi:hypothetical protein